MGLFKRLFGSSLESAEEYFRRGCQHERRAECDEAIAAFTLAIRLEPHWALAYNNRGFNHYLKCNFRRAAADFTKALQRQADAIEEATPDYDTAAAETRLELYQAEKAYRQEQ